jgi:hypothetical protein
LRTPLKRVTRSFTVEYRQTKRPSAGSTKAGWAHAKRAPAGVDQKADRIAISAFKTAAAHLPADVSSPSIAAGRILPSLVQVALVTEQVDAKGGQLRSYGGAAQAGYATEAPADEAVSGKLGEQIHSAEDVAPSVAAATITPLKRLAPLDPSASKAGTSRSEKRTRRPAEKREKFDHASGTSADMPKAPEVTSTADLSVVDEPSSPSRTSRILGRYVFRDERGPGESWKRRIEARRERRS